MRDHDLELIAALAEGRLDDESEARALIESSPEAAAEFEAQRVAIVALSSSGPAALTEHERALLRRQVWTELRGGTRQSKAAPRYLRWAPAMAALLLVAGVLGVMAPRMMGGGADEAMQEFSRGAESGDTVADAADGDAAPGGDDAGQPTQPLAATTTAGGAASLAIDEETESFLADYAARVRDGYRPYTTKGEEASREDCLAAAGLADHTILGVVEAPDRSEYLVASADEPVEQASISFVDLQTCTVAYVD